MATSFPFTTYATAAQLADNAVTFLGYTLIGPNLTPAPLQITASTLIENIPLPVPAFTANLLSPGSQPTVGPNTGTPTNPEYAIGIPAGLTGSQGPAGLTGAQGPVGPTGSQGPAGSIAGLPNAQSAQVSGNSVFVGLASDGVTPVTYSPSQVAATQTTAFGTMVTQAFTGTGSQTAFTLTTAPSAIAYSMVYVNGLLQIPGSYAISGATLSFNTAPANGATIQVLTINASTMAQNIKTIPSGSQVFAVADANGYTCFEVGMAGQVRPISFQFGQNQTTIPVFNSAGASVGSISSTGNFAMSGTGTFGGAVSAPSATFGGSTFQPSSVVNFGIRDANGYYLMYVLNGAYHHA